MPPNSLHTQHLIRCPKNVEHTLINPEGFADFIPPNVRVTEVRGLTLKIGGVFTIFSAFLFTLKIGVFSQFFYFSVYP
jgi:hypothetical protein